MKLQMSFGENLINLRKQKGWSQDDLADNLNLSRQAISKWENDTSKPDIDNIEKISKIFSVTIDDLLNNDVVKDKAVTLNVKKQEKREKTITIVKCMIIAVIILYIINVIFKFASLLIIVNGIQKYANLSNYHYVITTYDENGLVEKEECWFKDGLSKTINNMNENDKTTFIDYNKNEGYIYYSNQENKTSLDITQYIIAHKNYSTGGQLIDSLPKVISDNTLISIVSYSFNIGFKIDVLDNGIIIYKKNGYIVLEKENLLPIMSYNLKDKTTKNYFIEFNSNKNDNI